MENLLEKAKKLSCLCNARRDTILSAIENTTNISGEIWECGVAKGGTSLFIAINSNKTIRLFDTFSGMPYCSEYDFHQIGSMNDSKYEDVVELLKDFSNCNIYRGKIPETFVGLENSVISVAHIDVDNYDSVKYCLEFIYPRVPSGGYIIIDDYNDNDCKGAKKATDDFLRDKKEILISSPNPRNNPQVYFEKL